jgi:hypothetical protein
MLKSSRLTNILRKMIKEHALNLEGNSLVPARGKIAPRADEARESQGAIAEVLEETAAQWKMDFPDEPLVRFGKFFR